MLWISDHTPEYTDARLAALREQVRRATRRMALVAAGAATVQMVLEATYIFCL